MGKKNKMDKSAIIDLFKLGLEYRKIEKITGYSYPTVIKVCNEYVKKNGFPKFEKLDENKKYLIKLAILDGTFNFIQIIKITKCSFPVVMSYIWEEVKNGNISIERIIGK